MAGANNVGLAIPEDTKHAYGGQSGPVYDDSDANANHLMFDMEPGGAVHVPVIMAGIDIMGVDLGLFNGLTFPAWGVVDNDRDSAVALAFTADDVAEIKLYGSATLTLPATTSTGDLTYNDNVKATFGTGGDADIYYDGTNFIITPDVVGTGYINLDGDVIVSNAHGVVIGHTAQLTIDATVIETQILGTAGADSGVVIGSWRANANGPTFRMVKSRNAAIGSSTIVQDNDSVGNILAVADDGVDFATTIADILFEVDDASPVADSIGGAIVLRTARGAGADDITETLRLNAAGDSLFADGGGVVIGHTAQLALGAAVAPEFQQIGTAAPDSTGALARFSADSGSARVHFVKSRGATVATNTIVADNDVLGVVAAYAADGVDFLTQSAAIVWRIDDAAPAASDIGGDLSIWTASGGGADDIREIWTWSAAGNATMLGGAVLQSAGATEIGISVTNAALTVGSAGSLVVPYLSQTGALFTDAIGGDVDGAIGINYDSDTGPTHTIEVRSQGAWVSVAVSGYVINRNVPYSTLDRDVAWWHDGQIQDGHIDESVCVVCGEQMVKGDQVTMWANYERDRDLHAVFGHTHTERDPYIRQLEQRVAALEKVA